MTRRSINVAALAAAITLLMTSAFAVASPGSGISGVATLGDGSSAAA